MKKIFSLDYSLIYFFVIIFTLIFGINANAAENKVVNVSGDSFTYSDVADSNFGNLSSVKVSIYDNNTERSCAFVQFEDIGLDKTAIVDDANFSFNINLVEGDSGSKSMEVSPLDSAWDEATITEGNRPNYLVSDEYASVLALDVSTGEKSLDITRLVQAWVNGSRANNGISLCYLYSDNPSTFWFDSRELGNSHLKIAYHYPENDTALGDPVDNLSGIEKIDFNSNQTVNADLIQNNDGTATISSITSNSGNSQSANSTAVDSVTLLSPKDQESLGDASLTFEWRYNKSLSSDLRPSLVVKKSDGQIREIMLDRKDTSYSWNESFENGSYVWYIEIMKGADVVEKTKENNFLVNVSSSSSQKNKNTTNDNNSLGTKSENVDNNDKISNKDSTSINKNSEDQIGGPENESRNIIMWSILIVSSLALIALFGTLIYNFYNRKKEEKEKLNKK